MCGIFGMIGTNAVSNTLKALKLLEYRGYDSAGVAEKTVNGINIYKTVGRVEKLADILPRESLGTSAIGHTRWATHGNVCEQNAHPFYSSDKNFAVVHNGIIENHVNLKYKLLPYGIKFSSETDSEVIAHLLQKNYSNNVFEAVKCTANELEGAFAVAIVNSYDDKIYAVKNKSPLVVGITDTESFFCSDIRCVSHFAVKVAVVPDGAIAVASGNSVVFYDFEGNPLSVKFFTTDKLCDEQDVQGDYMLKEILEIPDKIRQAKQGYIKSGGLNLASKTVHRLKRIYLVGCGTAYNSGLQVAAIARRMLGIDVIPVIASEFIYDSYPVDSYTLAFCISQSGETADTIRAAEKVASMGGFTYAVTNTPTSSLSLMCDAVKNIHADGEYAVASTKAYNCQLIILTLLMCDLAYLKGSVSDDFKQKLYDAIDSVPAAIDKILDNSYEIARIAEKIKDSSAVFFIGRTADYPTAAEGSLKLKEISYIHSEAYPAGELKHGTLALMESGVTVVALACDSAQIDKMSLSVAEVAARGANVICVSPYNFDNATLIKIPVVNKLLYGAVSVVPLQLLAYYVAKRLGRDVDKPRNLAKSVTVE